MEKGKTEAISHPNLSELVQHTPPCFKLLPLPL